MQQTRPTAPKRNPDNGEPGRIRHHLPKAVITIKLDVFDIIFISLIIAAGAWSHVHFMSS